MLMSKRAEAAAKLFFCTMFPGEQFDYSDNRAKPLICAAFSLYEKEWRPYDIRKWEYPFHVLRASGMFSGDEPWTVLFRRAMELRGSPC